ncbi:MAG: hypothetical protein A2Y98_03370 [Candidatus Portnoybacteria bacterium RBG_19FT_COMBO_36_7]|uniref:Uncharacterized protein n=1 Tax=Candidatus Portnoybacteria bacterium RBG_19FT_COMBO_36_7 TaxID=1801992 RepID=A0A1G2F7Q5_9BACT|nr:MAG: hypothetical protein A2Y98_03370 [Candidatus Portnoybacteria bacterium RBG_19FT_COMBO_36_7]
MEQLKGGPKEPLMMPGPKFGNKGGWWSRFSVWSGRNRSNLILSVIGILIIAGGIYLYSNYQKANEAGIIEDILQQENDEGTVKPEQVNVGGQTGQTNQQTAGTSETEEKAEVTKLENAKITVRANKGAGITHLARKATKQYLESHPDLKKDITPEHKIYIEDYIKDRTGTYGLAIGQELTFDEGLIKEAVDNSQKLSETQLQNLHKYVLLVPSLTS